MDFNQQLNDALKTAMKAKDQVTLTTIRGLKARIKEREIEKGESLTEAEFIKLVQTAVKQRRESIKLYQEGKRPDLVEQETAELTILETYLPRMMSPDEMRSLVAQVVDETGANSMADMGKVMPRLMAASAGRADGKLLQQFVREILG
jgi:uncharacterized protein YqeY